MFYNEKSLLVISFLIFFVGFCNSKDKDQKSFFGEYQVVGYTSFPVSAMSDSECQRLMAKDVLLGSGFAVFQMDTCREIVYKPDSIKTQDYFGNLQPEIEKKIGIKLHQTIMGAGIYCGEHPWSAFPASLHILSNDFLLAESDGALFYLKRKRQSPE